MDGRRHPKDWPEVWDLLRSPRTTLTFADFQAIATLSGASSGDSVLALTTRDGTRFGEQVTLVDVVFRYRPAVIEALKREFGIDVWFVERPIKRWVVRCRRKSDIEKDRIYGALHSFFERILDVDGQCVVPVLPVHALGDSKPNSMPGRRA